MIRLFNHTRHPDAPIRRVLAFAARTIGVGGDVYVKVTPSLRLRPSAYAKRGFPYLGFMRCASDRKGRNGRLLGDKPGFAVLSLTGRRGKVDWLEACWWFMHTALHEMAHIRQFRENRYGILRLREAEMSRGAKRRLRHDARPCEVDAWDQVEDVKKDKRRYLRQQDLTIDLAVAIEEAESGGIRPR
jgi:hypothetical protein